MRLLEQEGAVESSSLAARFGVSGPTIRRDLNWLEREKLARRVRGGAVAIAGGKHDDANALYSRLGQAAANLVTDGETIFIGAGRMMESLARALAGRRLTVLTNSLAVAHYVAKQADQTLILTGGQLERDRQGLVGQLAQTALTYLRADHILVELSGVSAVDGLTQDHLAYADLTRALLEMGAEVVALVAPERVGRVAAAYVAPAAAADVVITAREADAALLWDLTELGVRVVLA